MHDAIEVCSWDKKPSLSTLNTRLIQMLEELGNPEAIEAMFLKCTGDLVENPDALTNEHLKNRHATMADKEEPPENDSSGGMKRTDSLLVFVMSLAKVNPNEPLFVDGHDRLVRKLFKNLRKKT